MPVNRSKEVRRGHQHDLILRFVKALNVLLMTLPFAISWFVCFDKQFQFFTSVQRSVSVLLMFAALYCTFGRIYDAFLLSLKRISELVCGQVLSILFSDLIMLFVIWFGSNAFPPLFPMLLTAVCQFLFSILWCRLGHIWYFAQFPAQRTGVIFDVRKDAERLFREYGLHKKFDIRFSYSVKECFAEKMQQLNDLDCVFLFGVHSHERNVILKHCIANDIDVYVIPRIGDVVMSGAHRMHLFHLPMLRVDRYNPPIEFAVLKRLFDIITSALAIVITSPLMLAIAIAIKVCDGGTIIYRQTRLTMNGRPFQMLKFRSMRVDAERDGVARLSTGDADDRITPVGRILRAYRLDELPQLFNILGGSMSVVGPRPERPEIAAQYELEMPEFALRLQAKAGLTGYAQVYGKYNTIPYDKLQMDLMYISQPSLIEDLRIIFATIQTLFMRDSTQGIAEGQITASDSTKDHAA